MKGYKVFDSDWTCRGFQYKVGKTYEHKGDISICEKGFHFCREIAKCFNYYNFNPNNKVAEIEALGNVESDSDKSVTDKIKIVREISWEEMLRLANSGESNIGIGNSGNRNSGNRNSGDRNSGFFNTKEATVRLFNRNTKYKYDIIDNCKGIKVLKWNYENNWWIYSSNMTEEEKKKHPEHETLGGYLKVMPYKDACKLMWDKLDDDEKQAVKEIPYFDAEVFKEITGIDVNKEEEE